MADPDPQDDTPAGADLKSFAQDWITIWHSELAAAAGDREAQENWTEAVARWAEAAHAMAELLPGSPPPSPADPHASEIAAATDRHGCHDGDASRSAAAAGSPPADAAPDARDAEIERLSARIAELERRLAALERGGG